MTKTKVLSFKESPIMILVPARFHGKPYISKMEYDYLLGADNISLDVVKIFDKGSFCGFTHREKMTIDPIVDDLIVDDEDKGC